MWLLNWVGAASTHVILFVLRRAAVCCDVLQAFGSLGILALILTSGFAIIRRE
jgi:hypothetical protein